MSHRSREDQDQDELPFTAEDGQHYGKPERPLNLKSDQQ